MDRRRFLAVTAAAAAVVSRPVSALAHHRPGHARGPGWRDPDPEPVPAPSYIIADRLDTDDVLVEWGAA